MKYCLMELRVAFPLNSIRIKYYPPAKALYMDRSTVTSLELLQTIRPTTSKGSTLFAILDDTRTPEGHRLLRATLLQPSNCWRQIKDRWNAIGELLAGEHLVEDMTSSLKALRRIDMAMLAMWVSVLAIQVTRPISRSFSNWLYLDCSDGKGAATAPGSQARIL